MFGTPTPNSSKTPAKTPRGWAAALGIFTSGKKPAPPSAVDSGTHDTSMMNGGLSAVAETSFRSDADRSTLMNNSISSDAEPFMSPISPNLSPDKSAGNLSMTGGSIAASYGGGSSRASRLEFSALSSRMSSTKSNPVATDMTQHQLVATNGDQMTLRNSKSPWQGRQNANTGYSANLSVSAKSPWQGSRSRRARKSETTVKQLTFYSSTTSERTRKYRPNAFPLVGRSNRLYNKREFNHENISKALVTLKDSYLSGGSQSASTNVYAVRGKVQWGSSSRPNRLPRPSQKRQRPMQDMQEDIEEVEDHEGTSRKRRKKVSFDQEEDNGNAVVTRMTATPFPKSAANRKGTPMPSKFTQSTPATADSVDSGTPDREEISQTAARPDNLPEAPRRLEFPTARLDSDAPFTLDFSVAKHESFDAVTLNPVAERLHLGWKNPGSVSREASQSFTGKSEFDASRYDRPPSPIREGKKKPNFGDDDGIHSQATKRTKTSQNDGNEPVGDFVCHKCGHVNPDDETTCLKCKAGRKADPNGPMGWGNFMFADETKIWRCSSCFVENQLTSNACESCEEPRSKTIAANAAKKAEQAGGEPAKTKTAAPAPAPSVPSKTSFPFATNSNSNSGGKFTFGTSGSTPTLPVPTGKPTESQFSFPAPGTAGGSKITSSGFTFGGTSSTSPAVASTAGGFTFSAAPAADSSTPGGFVFDKGAASKDSDDKNKTAGASKATFTFGTPAASAPAPQTSFKSQASSNSDGTSGFKAPAPATEGKKSLSAKAKPFAFTGSSGENGDKKPAASKDTTAASAHGTTPSFGFGKQPGESKTKAGPGASFAFNPSNSTPADAPVPAVSFGGPPANAATAAGFSFGATPAPAPAENSDKKVKRRRGYDLNGDKPSEKKAPAPAQPTLFGAPAPAPSDGSASNAAPFQFNSAGSKSDGAGGNGAAPVAQFGGHQNSAPVGGSQFGSVPDSKAAAPAAPFVFGAGASAAPTPAPAAAGAFGSSNPPAPAAPLFGSGTGAPAFGNAPAPAGPGFGSAPAPAMSFGSAPAGGAPAPPGFGSATAPAPGAFGSAPVPAGMSFGSVPAPAPPATSFGTTPGAPGPAPGGFGFGGGPTGFGAAKPAVTPAAPAFGANPNPPSTGFGGGPAFGAQTPAAPTPGFNGTSFGGGAPGFGATPAPAGGFGASNFGAPQTGGFPTTSTPAPSGGFGGFGGGVPQTAPQAAGAGFSLGTSGPKKGRRIIRAKRPNRA